MITRRRFNASTPLFVAGPLAAVAACSPKPQIDSYEALAWRTWQRGPLGGLEGAALAQELVRCATLAPSSHNSQCWRFALGSDRRAISILPDFSRRCPAVDPDDHHLFVSLGCAAENLVQAGLAHGLHGEVEFDPATGAVRVGLEPTAAKASPLFSAIAERQCTRGNYDGHPLSSTELALLQRAGSSDRVRLLLMTGRVAKEQTLDQVIEGNSVQMADPGFVRELKTWIRFNSMDAVRTRDGLYSGISGNPNLPAWLGERLFGWFVTPQIENDKYARQVRSAAGIAVFVGQVADQAHWVEVGRCYERFALQATALGIRNAFLNQPIEVASLRPGYASTIELPGQRPDLIVRFGRGASMPVSLRRPVQEVLA